MIVKREVSGEILNALDKYPIIAITGPRQSEKTIHQDFFKTLNQFKKIKPGTLNYLAYGGNEMQKRSQCTVVGFNNLDQI